ncbi:MAG: hypothetical protein AAGJ10_06955 [Bacteroidota bacterium]
MKQGGVYDAFPIAFRGEPGPAPIVDAPMKTEQIVKELAQAARQMGLTVRMEKGGFRGGRCRVNDDRLIVLNKLHPPERHLAILATSLQEQELDTVFLKPAVRRALQQSWAQQAAAVEVDVTEGADAE